MMAETPQRPDASDQSAGTPPPTPPEAWAGRCGRRRKSCRKCERRFAKTERDVWVCPDCGTDRHCLAAPVAGAGTACRFHGGKSLAGAANGNYRGAGYSRRLPTKLAERLNEALDDPELLSLKQDAALLVVRAGELAERLSTGESGQLWKRLRESWTAVRQAGDAMELRAAMDQHERILRDGANYETTWSELIATVNNRVAVARAAHTQQEELRQYILAEDAFMMLDTVVTAIHELVADRKICFAISQRVASLLNWPGVKLPAALPAISTSPQSIDFKESE